MPLHSLPLYRGISHLWGLPGWLGRRRLGDYPQIVGNDAPADPAFHPGSPVIAAPVQSMTPFQATDAPFDARPPIPPTSEPALLFVGEPLGRFCPGLGQDHSFAPVRGGIPLVRGGVDPAISCQQAGRAREHPQMMVQARRQLRVLRWVALQNGVPTDDAAR